MRDAPPKPAEPRPGLYRHYKGGEYEVLGVVRHSESLEPLVLYRALYGEQGLWVRPHAMFFGALPSGAPRFAHPVADQLHGTEVNFHRLQHMGTGGP